MAQVFEKIFGKSARELDMGVVYDVSHNICKEESYVVDGKQRRLLVHRKGATRAFPPRHPDVPAAYADIGQPVLVGGSMGHSLSLPRVGGWVAGRARPPLMELEA